MTFSLISPVFADGQPIPQKYTRFGENLFPPLKWTGTPEATQSFALIVEDPDAVSGLFRHCSIINIPGSWTELPQAVDTGPERGIKLSETISETPVTTGRSRLPEQACTVTGSGLPPSTRPIFRSPTTWARQKPGRGPASISSARRRSSAHTKGRCKHFQKRCV